MKKKKILILGVSSFAGFSFYQYIKNKNFKIYGTYNRKKNIGKFTADNIILKKANFEANQINLLKWIKKIQPQYIIDFASICMVNESWKYPSKYFLINFYSKIKLLKFLSDQKFLKKFIYISSPEVFGDTKKKLEEKLFEFKPSTPYASSKLSLENYLSNLNTKKKFIISRFSNFYGPYQPNYRLIPKTILSILANEKITIHGNGLSKRNYIFVDDFCEGILKILKTKKNNDIYHFSGDDFYTVKEIVDKICKIMNVKFNDFVIFVKDRKGKDKIYNLKSFKTRKLLKWKTETNLDMGLKKIINFIEKNKKMINKRPAKFKISN